jgi:hypothetical protein
MRNLILLIFTFFISVSSAFAQLTIQGEMRARSEYRDGSRILLSDSLQPTLVSSQRTRLITTYQEGDFKMRVTFQNARIWGVDDERKNIPNLNLAEGWVQYEFLEGLDFKVGRQHFVLDDGRIFGKRNWNDIAVSHDLVRLRWETSDWTIMAAGAVNNDGNDYSLTDYNNALGYYKYLGVLHINKDLGNGWQASLLHSVDATEDTANVGSTFNRLTTGAYVKHSSKGNFGLQASFYYQHGQHTSGLNQDAYMYSIIPTYRLNDKISFAGGTNYFSGNNQLNQNKTTNQSFNKLFGDGHRYYGYLDYFLNIESNTQGTGMNEFFGSVFFQTGEKSELEISYHHFSTAGVLAKPEGVGMVAADSELGSEIDLQFKHKINNFLSARLAYATMFASPSMELIKGGDHKRYQQWAKVMLIAKPQFFNSDK